MAELREEVVARLWDWVDYTSTISDGKKKKVFTWVGWCGLCKRQLGLSGPTVHPQDGRLVQLPG